MYMLSLKRTRTYLLSLTRTNAVDEAWMVSKEVNYRWRVFFYLPLVAVVFDNYFTLPQPIIIKKFRNAKSSFTSL